MMRRIDTLCNFVGKARRKQSLGRWEDNVKRVSREIGWDSMDWIHLANNVDHLTTHMNVVKILWVP
jgi:hypothetical protein